MLINVFLSGRKCLIKGNFLAAESAGLGLIPPSMEPGADFSNGANFASTAACILDTTAVIVRT